MEKKKKSHITKQKVSSKFIAIRNAIQKLNPDFYFPSAGPAIFPFLDPTLSTDEDNIFVHQPRLDKFLKKQKVKSVYLKPGNKFCETKTYNPIPSPNKESF